MARLLVQSRGSENDPGYHELAVGDLSFLDYFHRENVQNLETDLVNSAHGCTDLTLAAARDIQALADEGHRIVMTDAGGLLWVKPGFDAANMPTVPVISIPLQDGWYGGVSAFLAPMVPSGLAISGGVSTGDYETAANVAKIILTSEFYGVHVYNPSQKLIKKLAELHIPVIGEVRLKDSETSGLVLGCLKREDQVDDFLATGKMGIFTPYQSNDLSDLGDLMGSTMKMGNGVWVRGDENVAFYAAKVVSSYNKGAFGALKKASQSKRNGYEDRRIILESFTSGERVGAKK